MTTAPLKQIATGALIAVGLALAALAAGPAAAHPCRDCAAPRPDPVVHPCQFLLSTPAERLDSVVAPPTWAMTCVGVDVIFQADEMDEANHAAHTTTTLLQ